MDYEIVAVPVIAAFVFSLMLGPVIIPFLRRLKVGQTERINGVQSHLKKMGTPTMGGLIFLISTTVTSLFFVKGYPKIIPVLFLMLGFGLIGFLDDYLKVVLRRSDGLLPGQKLVCQIIVTAVFAFYIYVASLLATLLVCLVAAGACLIYLSLVGWYLSIWDVLLMLLDVFLLAMFGMALSSIVNSFLSTEGQISAVGTIISAGYGFLCGAYMPISQFGEGLQRVLGFFPGTYGTSLLRNHALGGVLAEMESQGVPAAVTSAIGKAVDCKLDFYGNQVGRNAMYLIVAGSVAVLLGVYVGIYIWRGKKARK